MKISFDYDDTLTMPIIDKGGLRYVPRPEYIDKAKEYVKNGDTVIIVTARSNTPKNQNEIAKFIKETGIQVESIHYTNHTMKGPILSQLKVDIHYDDREDHVASANQHGVKGVHVEPIDPWVGVRSALMNSSKIRRT